MSKHSRPLLSSLLLASALGATVAGCQVSTSGLLKQATSPGSSGSPAPTTSSSGGGGEASETADPTSASGGGSDSGSADAGSFDVPFVKPAPGVASVGAYRAPWCKKATPVQGWSASGLSRLVGNYPLDAADKAAPLLCMHPDDGRFQKLVGAYVQHFVNHTGATPAQVAEYLALFLHPGEYNDLNEATCKKLVIDPEASERDQAIVQSQRAVLGCDRYGQAGKPMWLDPRQAAEPLGLWDLDREAAVPSQLLAVHHVLNCVSAGAAAAGPDAVGALVQYAGCRADVAQLDEKKLRAELERGGFNEQARITAVLTLAQARYRASLLEQALAAKAKADPDLKAALIDAPEQGWREWVTARQSNKEAIDAARAYEDAYYGPRRSAARGCLRTAQANFDAFTRRPGKSRDAVLATLTSPVGMILVEHLRSCSEIEGRKVLADSMAMIARRGTLSRGPRLAAHRAMSAEVARILSDRPKFAITPSMLAIVGASGGGPELEPPHAGIVAKVETRGELVYVTFRTDKRMEKERLCKPTNRINMIRPDGTLLYEYNCVYTGKMIQRTDTPQPFFTTPELARGIAPGTYVRYGTTVDRDDAGSTFAGLVVDVWKSSDMDDLIAMYGVLAR